MQNGFVGLILLPPSRRQQKSTSGGSSGQLKISRQTFDRQMTWF